MSDSALVPAPSPASLSNLDTMSAMLQGVASAPLQYVYSKPAPDPTDEDATLEYAAEISGFLAGDADYKASDALGLVINLVHVFLHPAIVRETDDDGNWTGGYKSTERIVLIDDQGATYECQSDGLFQSLLAIFQLPGIGTPNLWKKPLRVTIKQVSVRDKWRTFKLQVLGPSQETPSLKKKTR